LPRRALPFIFDAAFEAHTIAVRTVSYTAVLVHQTERLPWASCRFHLTLDTLAVFIKHVVNFHHQVIAPAGHTTTKRRENLSASFYQLRKE
jgi:hypothetical protein